MKIICLGDLACPEESDVEILRELIENNKFFEDKFVIANLEGLLVKNEEGLLEKYNNALFNNETVLELFASSKKTFFSLANNHVKDIPEQFEYTLQQLKENEIGYSGASFEKESSIKPYEVEIEGKKYAIFSHCWKVMSDVIKNKSKDIYINDIAYKEIIKIVKDYKNENKDTCVIVYFHWNFDFEKLPFPIHIDIAHTMIDNGADMILGGHSHLVNGGEIYMGKPVIYGFGNFYIPSNKFLNKKLQYPVESEKNIILEIDTKSNDTKIYWINKNKIELIEDLEDGRKISKVSIYKKMTLKEYNKYFRKNRNKKILIPVFKKVTDKTININELIILFRMKLLRFLKGIK